MDLVVCEEFRDLIPPLQASEYQQLEENILRDGCTTPLDVWKRNGELVIVQILLLYNTKQRVDKRLPNLL